MIVPAEGNPKAKLAIIGEGPGDWEWKLQRPFIGPTGKILMAILEKFNLKREDCYLTNVIKDQIIISPLEKLATKEKKTGFIIPSQRLMDYRKQLHEELEQTSCNVYALLGNTALWAMTGQSGIEQWRNSILSSQVGGRKVIPTYHPAAALRDTALYDLILNDFKRIVQESETNVIDTPRRNLIVKPTIDEALDFLRMIKDERLPFAFDVETAGGIVDCISFAADPGAAMSINFIDNYWSREDFGAVYLAIKSLLEDPTIVKIGQNVAYDIIALRAQGINVAPPFEDTMHKHHCLDPLAKHSLAFMASTLTREPFYKEWDVAPSAAIQNRLEYNANDSAVTIEVSSKLDEMLGSRKAFYIKHYQQLHPHLLEMYHEGLLVDSTKRAQLASETKERAFKIENEIANKLSIKAFNSNSPKQTAEVVYGTLGCKPRLKMRNKKTKNRTLSTDEETLLLLYQQEPIDVLMKIIDAREARKLVSFLEPTTKSALAKRRGEIIRTEYKPMTKTGRLMSSASTATKEGLNLQNQPKKVRSIFIPRPGFVFVELDLSQAEARVTAWDAENHDLMHYFEQSKIDRRTFDVHKRNAAISLGKQQSEITKQEREACKRVVHGTNYGMEAKKQQLTLLKELRNDDGGPFWLPLSEVERRRNRYLESDPSVLVRQSRIRQEVLRTRRQITPYGRVIIFHEIINDRDVLFHFGQRDYSEIFRIAYAYVPQSTVADLVGLALVESNTALRRETIGRVAAQVHDSLLLEVRDHFEAVDCAVRVAKQSLERSVMIRGNLLSIPADIKLGRDWSCPFEVESLEHLEEVYGTISPR